MLSNIVFFIQVLSALVIVILVLLQPSKGSDLVNLSGGSNPIGKGYVDLPTKITGFFVILFIISSFYISYLNKVSQYDSVISLETSENINVNDIEKIKDLKEDGVKENGDLK